MTLHDDSLVVISKLVECRGRLAWWKVKKKKKLAFKVLSLYAVAGLRRPTLVHVTCVLVYCVQQFLHPLGWAHSILCSDRRRVATVTTIRRFGRDVIHVGGNFRD